MLVLHAARATEVVAAAKIRDQIHWAVVPWDDQEIAYERVVAAENFEAFVRGLRHDDAPEE